MKVEGTENLKIEMLRPGDDINKGIPSMKSSMSKTTLREANIVRAKEWAGEVELSLSFAGNELAGEVGEACNIIKKMERQRLGIKTSAFSVEALEEELADVVICVDLIAMKLGIDLDAAIKSKFNKTSVKMGFDTRYV